MPEHLRSTAKAMFGVSRELIANLKTRDATAAKAAAPTEIARLDTMLVAIHAAHEGRPEGLSEQTVMALAGVFDRDESAKWAADPGLPATWEAAQDYLLWKAEVGPGEPDGHGVSNRFQS